MRVANLGRWVGIWAAALVGTGLCASAAHAQYGGGAIVYATTTSGSTGYCDAVCNLDSPCTTGCTLRQQVCSGSYAVPTSNNYATDNGTNPDGTAGYGTTYRNYALSAFAAETVPKDSSDASLVCVNGTESYVTTTCGNFGRCVAGSGSCQIASGVSAQALACTSAIESKAARRGTKPAEGNNWFKVDFEYEGGGESKKISHHLGAKVNLGVRVFGSYMNIASLTISGKNKFGPVFDSPGDRLDAWFAGFSCYLSQRGSVIDYSGMSNKVVENVTADYPNSGRSTDKKSYTWTPAWVPIVLGPVHVRVSPFVKAGWDFDAKFDTVKHTGGLVGAVVSLNPKAYLHAGVAISASVFVAAMGVTGVVNLLTLSPLVKVFIQAQNPHTKAFDVAYVRTYASSNISYTALDGYVELWLRIFWQRWKWTIAHWTALSKTWLVGGNHQAQCHNLTAGSTENAELTSSDYVNFVAP